MNLLNATILGIVEGITEFLPISSTGHLILTSKLLGLQQTDFMKTFEIAIQLGAILAVVVLYFRRILVEREIILKVGAAFVPTAIVGFILYKFIKHRLMGNDSVVLWALFLGGVVLIIFDLLHKEKNSSLKEIAQISYTQAAVIGLFQSLAVIPGVSRAAATIVGGLILGVGRKTIVEFSFLLAIPTMLAATGLDLLKGELSLNGDQLSFFAVGFVTSFFVALLSIKFLLAYIQKNNFILFGVYRILLVLFFWFIAK